MKKSLTIKIELENEAFEDNYEKEISECLEKVKAKISLDYLSHTIYDTNGNEVGYFKIKGIF